MIPEQVMKFERLARQYAAEHGFELIVDHRGPGRGSFSKFSAQAPENFDEAARYTWYWHQPASVALATFKRAIDEAKATA